MSAKSDTFRLIAGWLGGASRLALICALGGLWPTSAADQKIDPVPVSRDIREQPLSDALGTYARSAGISIVVDSRLVDGKTSGAIAADLPPGEALEGMLSGSKLGYRQVGQYTYVIDRQAVSTGSAPVAAAQTSIIAPVKSVNVPVEELVVIGRETPRFLTPQGSPVVTIGGQNVSMSAELVPANALLGMPMIESSVSYVNSAALGSRAGMSMVQLRGLGSQRTLVLLNGRRVATSPGGTGTLEGTDLNGIPFEDIDRIEIVRGTVAANYGPEVVGGVINFIMDQDLEGFELTARGSLTESGGRGTINSSLSYGTRFADGAGMFSATISWGKAGGLALSDREATSDPAWFALDGRAVLPSEGVYTRGFGGSGVGPSGLVGGYIDAAGNFNNFQSGEGYQFSPDGTELVLFERRRDQLYNFANGQSLFAPMERWSTRLYADYQPGDATVLRLEGSYTRSDISSRMAPSLTFHGGTGHSANSPYTQISLDHPAISSQVRETILSESGGQATAISMHRRYTELGLRLHDISRSQYHLGLTIEHEFDDFWYLEVFAQTGASLVRNNHSGLVDGDKYLIATDLDLCAAVPDCNPVNPVASASRDAESAAFYAAPAQSRETTTRLHLVEMALQGEQHFLGRPLDIEAGLELRRSTLDDNSASQENILGGNAIYGTQAKGHINLASASLGARWLALENHSLARSLLISPTLRYTRQSNAGGAISFSQVLDWQPADGLALSAAWHFSERLPNLAELHGIESGNHSLLSDPCSGFHDTDNPALAVACRAVLPESVHENFVQSTVDVYMFGEGNPDLESEKVKTTAFGLDLSSDPFLGDTSLVSIALSVDYYRTSIRNAVDTPSAAQILQLCFFERQANPDICSDDGSVGRLSINRDPVSGQLQSIFVTPINAGRRLSRGLESELLLSYSPADTGRFRTASLAVFYHWGLTNKLWIPGNDGFTDRLGTVQFPRHRVQARAAIEFDRVSLGWTVSWRGRGYGNVASNGFAPALAPSVTYHDLEARIKVNENAQLHVGIQNLTDREPPFFAFSSAGGTSPEYYDVIGRRFSLGLKASF